MHRGASLSTGRTTVLCCACASILTMSGCAMMMNMRPAADSYTYDLGTAQAPEVRPKAEEALRQFGFKLNPDDGTPGVYLQSQWQKREPVDEQERASGYEIISRVKLSGRETGMAGTARVYHVFLTVENRFVPMHGTSRTSSVLSAPTGSTYARSIVKQVSVAFAGTSRPVADEPRPF